MGAGGRWEPHCGCFSKSVPSSVLLIRLYTDADEIGSVKQRVADGNDLCSAAAAQIKLIGCACCSSRWFANDGGLVVGFEHGNKIFCCGYGFTGNDQLNRPVELRMVSGRTKVIRIVLEVLPGNMECLFIINSEHLSDIGMVACIPIKAELMKLWENLIDLRPDH